MQFITYYTSQYKECAKLLIEDAKNLKLDLIAEELDDFRSWQQATRFKAVFIQGYLRQFGDDVCWIDADARIRKDPTVLTELSSKDYDVAAVYFKGTELLSGTLWMADNDAVHALIADWISLNQDSKRARHLEQQNLQRAIENNPEIRVRKLPPEYAYIFDLSKRVYPDIEPVIEHLQRSRAIRKQENVTRVFDILRNPKPLIS